MKRIFTALFAIFSLFSLAACSHSDDEVKTHEYEKVVAYYNEVTLDWSTNTFTHNDYTIVIPDKWGYGIKGQRDKFKEYDPHDIEFCYKIDTQTTYGGTISKEGLFDELIYVKPESIERIFEISVVGLDIDSKLFIKDEFVNDCYFKYDSNPSFNNYCYFKMAKNDINQLKEGYFNQINVKLKYYQHIDDSCDFLIAEEKDGLNNIGIYSNVSISHNPDLVE